MSGVRDIKKEIKSGKGSVTIETAIVMPVFLIVIFSLAYIIRIFFVYNTVQFSLSEVARRIANMSYFYHVSGLKELSDQLADSSDEAKNALISQRDTILNAFDSFNGILSGMAGSGNSFDSDYDIQNLIDKARELDENLADISDLAQSIINDPEAELSLFFRVFTQRLTYEANKALVCLIAKADLGSELKKRMRSEAADAALEMGIKGGIKGMDFSRSGVFGDKETLDFVVHYTVKPPFPFIVPSLRLSNRVKIVAWTGGRGKSVRITEEDDTETPDEDASIWTQMDQDNRFWDRGMEIENIHVGKIVEESSSQGLEAFDTADDYPVIDAYTYDRKNGSVEFYDVFTLNPYLKTYSERHSAISYEIKKHGKRLLECDAPEYLKSVEVRRVKRIVIMIVPEGSPSYVTEAFEKAKSELEKSGVELRLVMGYGTYSPPVNDDELAEAS